MYLLAEIYILKRNTEIERKNAKSLGKIQELRSFLKILLDFTAENISLFNTPYFKATFYTCLQIILMTNFGIANLKYCTGTIKKAGLLKVANFETLII